MQLISEKLKVKVAQSCPTLCDLITIQSMEFSRTEYWFFSFCLFLLQGIFPTHESCIAIGFFTSWATGEAQEYWSGFSLPSNRTGISGIAGRFFTNWALREAPLLIYRNENIVCILTLYPVSCLNSMISSSGFLCGQFHRIFSMNDQCYLWTQVVFFLPFQLACFFSPFPG